MKMKTVTIIIATAVGFLTTPALLAQHKHVDHSSHQQPVNTHKEHAAILPKSVQTVFDHYIKIQTALAEDSIENVRASAATIRNSVQSDPDKTLPAAVAEQAEALAKAGDIKSAREAFKLLSDSLLKYLAGNKAHASHYVRVYCPMAKARWLQTGTAVNNPYFGKSMAGCGKIES